MSNFYKENGLSQPGIGYYAQRINGEYTPLMATEHMHLTGPDGSEQVVSKVMGRLHWMHPSALRKPNPVPGFSRFIEVSLVPNKLQPRYDPARRN